MRKRIDTSRLTAVLYGVLGLSVVTGLAWVGSPARTAKAATPQDQVNAAYAAMGGGKLKTIRLKAHMVQYDPGESFSFSDPSKPDRGEADVVRSRDFTRGLTRNEWVRPRVDGSKMTFTEIVTPSAGYVIGNDAVEGRLPKRTV